MTSYTDRLGGKKCGLFRITSTVMKKPMNIWSHLTPEQASMPEVSSRNRVDGCDVTPGASLSFIPSRIRKDARSVRDRRQTGEK